MRLTQPAQLFLRGYHRTVAWDHVTATVTCPGYVFIILFHGCIITGLLCFPRDGLACRASRNVYGEINGHGTGQVIPRFGQPAKGIAIRVIWQLHAVSPPSPNAEFSNRRASRTV
jgi:hypothetical protein